MGRPVTATTSDRRRSVLLAVLGAVHGLLSLATLLVCATLAAVASMITDPCGPSTADDPRCDGTTLTTIWILLALAALAGPTLGTIGLVKALRRRALWAAWLGAGWGGSLLLFMLAMSA